MTTMILFKNWSEDFMVYIDCVVRWLWFLEKKRKISSFFSYNNQHQTFTQTNERGKKTHRHTHIDDDEKEKRKKQPRNNLNAMKGNKWESHNQRKTVITSYSHPFNVFVRSYFFSCSFSHWWCCYFNNFVFVVRCTTIWDAKNAWRCLSYRVIYICVLYLECGDMWSNS